MYLKHRDTKTGTHRHEQGTAEDTCQLATPAGLRISHTHLFGPVLGPL